MSDWIKKKAPAIEAAEAVITASLSAADKRLLLTLLDRLDVRPDDRGTHLAALRPSTSLGMSDIGGPLLGRCRGAKWNRKLQL